MTNEELVKEIQSGTDRFLDLYSANKGLLYKIALRYTWGAELDDLIQTGYLALRDAALNYKPDEEALFSSYAYSVISSRLQAYADANRPLSIPSYRREQARLIGKLSGTIELVEGRTPTDRELCVRLGCDQSTLKAIRLADMAPTSIDAETADGLPLGDTIPDRDNTLDALEKVQNEELREDLEREIRTLEPDQQDAIRARYWHGLTAKQLGKQGKKAHDRAIRELRKKEHRKRLEPYLLRSTVYNRVGVSDFLQTWTSSTEREALRI